MTNIEGRLIELGWEYFPPGSHGGWTHWDVRDNDGNRIAFDSADDVARYLGLERCEGCS